MMILFIRTDHLRILSQNYVSPGIIQNQPEQVFVKIKLQFMVR